MLFGSTHARLSELADAIVFGRIIDDLDWPRLTTNLDCFVWLTSAAMSVALFVS